MEDSALSTVFEASSSRLVYAGGCSLSDFDAMLGVRGMILVVDAEERAEVALAEVFKFGAIGRELKSV